MKRAHLVSICLYAVIAVGTFGHAFVGIEAKEQGRCARANSWCNPTELAGYGGFLSALAWPMYWSVQFNRSMGSKGNG